MVAEEADPELGYIVADGGGDVSAVRDFVEKPDVTTARALIARGGVWNSFIFAANGQTLLRRFEQTCPDLVAEMRQIIESVAPSAQMSRLAELYARSPNIDFSRDILQRSTESLRVLRVPACGWSDLGTPHRVIETVQRMKSQTGALASAPADPSAFLNLAGRMPGLCATG
jgi:mannose-1-phosphate guanylyltransferase